VLLCISLPIIVSESPVRYVLPDSSDLSAAQTGTGSGGVRTRTTQCKNKWRAGRSSCLPAYRCQSENCQRRGQEQGSGRSTVLEMDWLDKNSNVLIGWTCCWIGVTERLRHAGSPSMTWQPHTRTPSYSLYRRQYFFSLCDSPQWASASSLLRLHDRTQTHHSG
jgi:hypothetical protein